MQHIIKLLVTGQIIAIAMLLTGCIFDGHSGNSPETDVSGLDQRPSNTICIAGDRPVADGNIIDYQRAFPNLSFNQPVALLQAPSDGNRWYLVEKGGKVLSFDNDDAATTTTTFIDLSNIVDARSEGGLLGMAFHPDYAANNYVFLSYTTSINGKFQSRISRFTAGTDRTVLMPDSELILLTLDQPYDNHDGGNIAFGPENSHHYLYIGFGDGGSGGDPDGNGQNTHKLLGKMLRIDVDVSQQELAAGINYKIPSDNPFVASQTCSDSTDCPEIYAWGFRNPWRWSFDQLSGDLWVGDVGQNAWEEVDRVDKGKNYGWRCYEGNHEYDTTNCGPATDYVFPLAEYEHPLVGGTRESRSITGGYVYRGSNIPELTGTYLYADYQTGEMWGLFDPKGTATVKSLLQTGLPISSFAQDHNGEVYFLGLFGPGAIYRIVPGGNKPASAFPTQLSETGCANTADPKLPASGMIPYDVNAKLWSDGAIKQRWIALPDNQTIHIKEDNDWEFPIGSILRKDFYLNDKIIETRLFVRHTDGGWAGYSYEWNDTQTDATLLNEATQKSIDNQSWYFPSSTDCLMCHTVAAGRTLGPETAQLNGNLTYPSTGRTANQLTTFNAIGLFDTPLANSSADLPTLPDPNDKTQSVASRARAYLHINCSQCHRPGGPGRGGMDFRFQTAFKDMSICDKTPETGDLGVADERLFTPGDPAKSVISLRMHDTGQYRMPPLGSSIVDADGTTLVDAWITSVNVCP